MRARPPAIRVLFRKIWWEHMRHAERRRRDCHVTMDWCATLTFKPELMMPM
ncbi:hypothetical protein [Falsiroseomonas sp. HW251]|uniref:hypothetical protein n=1 Tax=Falsiroseomonas sp. HW251 TaxID=3390998 RepID=UPI003D321C6E